MALSKHLAGTGPSLISTMSPPHRRGPRSRESKGLSATPFKGEKPGMNQATPEALLNVDGNINKQRPTEGPSRGQQRVGVGGSHFWKETGSVEEMEAEGGRF